jgi:hypothetical protein
MFTGRDIYRMLVREREWSPQKYQDRLADALVQSILTRGKTNPNRNLSGRQVGTDTLPTLRTSWKTRRNTLESKTTWLVTLRSG